MHWKTPLVLTYTISHIHLEVGEAWRWWIRCSSMAGLFKEEHARWPLQSPMDLRKEQSRVHAAGIHGVGIPERYSHSGSNTH